MILITYRKKIIAACVRQIALFATLQKSRQNIDKNISIVFLLDELKEKKIFIFFDVDKKTSADVVANSPE